MPTQPPDETAPLLSPSRERRPNAHFRGILAASARILQPDVSCVLFLQFVTMFAFYHLLAPKLRLLELSICRTYYETHDPSLIRHTPSWPGYDIDENKCKVHDIQRELSRLRAWGVLLDSLCVLFLSIPYGILADRYGRKLVYCISLFGLITSNVWFLIVCTNYNTFPLTAVLGSSAFLVFGGGSYVLIAIAITMGSDGLEEKDRSIVLYWLLSMYFLGYVTGTGLSPITMQVPWLPYLLVFITWTVAFIITIFMPLRRQKPDGERLHDPTPNGHGSPNTRTNRMKDIPATLRWSAGWVKSHSTLAVAILLFPIMATRGALPEIVLPYVSNRYGWPLSRAATLDSIGGTVGLVLGLIVLPLIAQIYGESGPSAIRANYNVARWSAITLASGALIVGLAGSVGIMITGFVIYSLGFGVRMAVLTLVSSLVLPHQLARLNMVVITSETIADLTSSPLLWKLWSFALDTGGAALGLPWFAVAIAFFLVALILWTLDFVQASKDAVEISDSRNIGT